MKPPEWFRHTEWNDEIAIAFEARLKRSRSAFHKAQYLRIQGWTLVDSKRSELIRAGITLSLRVVDEYPNVFGEIGLALHAIGTGFELLGINETAVDYYRKAWAFQRKHPTTLTDAPIDLAVLIVKSDRRGDADEALAAIRPMYSGDSDIFPVTVMRKSLVRASVASWRGDAEAAIRFATQGLQAASMSHSGFPRHPTVGIVGGGYKAEVALLKRLAQS